MVVRVNAIASYPPPNAKSERRNDTGTIFECNLVLGHVFKPQML